MSTYIVTLIMLGLGLFNTKTPSWVNPILGYILGCAAVYCGEVLHV
jgi:hypothetical protein